MTTIVKIGTESLQNFETSQKVNTLIRDISTLIRDYHEKIILVTSGAVGFGRKIAPEITDKHVLAAIGWGPLLEGYRRKFDEEGIVTAGILATHPDIEDFENRRNRLVETINGIHKSGALPIINENDALSVEEMNQVARGADNDKNALLLAKLFRAKHLMIITNTNGVLLDVKNPKLHLSKIDARTLTNEYIASLCGKTKSSSGTGGMQSKLLVAREAAKNHISTVLLNGIDSTILEHFTKSAHGGTEIYKK